MNTPLILTLVLAFFLTACGQDTAAPAPQEQTTSQTPTALPAATLENGEQVITVTIGPTGYVPDALELKQGIPARLVFTRTTDNTCAKEIHSPDLGIAKTPIPLNESAAITFTPEQSGTFTFVCGMDMLEGTIIVKA